MTQVDFYILPKTDSDLLGTAVRLCEKAWKSGLKTYVHVDDEAIADEFDRALWSRRQGSFLSHERDAGNTPDEPMPAVVIGSGEPQTEYQDLLLNLGSTVPESFSRCKRVLEIAGGDDNTRAAARARYKFYRDRGYPMNTHEL